MSILSNLLSQIYKISELKVPSISKILNNTESVLENYLDLVIEINHELRHSEYYVMSVDSGFTEIKYLGSSISLTCVVGYTSFSKPKILMKLSTLKGEELSQYSRALEYELLIEMVNDISENFKKIVLIDGPLTILGEKSSYYLNALKKYLNICRYHKVFTIAHIKDTSNVKYFKADDKNIDNILKIINEKLLTYILLSIFRKKIKSDNPLILKPRELTIDYLRQTIYFSYIQYLPNSLPILIEFPHELNNELLEMFQVISKLSKGFVKGYPTPLYIVDKLSKITEDITKFITSSLSKLSLESLSRYSVPYFAQDLRGYLRG